MGPRVWGSLNYAYARCQSQGFFSLRKKLIAGFQSLTQNEIFNIWSYFWNNKDLE